MNYEIIYADPPWNSKAKVGHSRRIKNVSKYYNLLDTDYIADVVGEKVRAVANPDGSLLFLWAVNNMLPDALRVMESWGYEYKTNFTWVKGKLGTGFYNRGSHELLLLGKNGSTPYTRLGMFSKGRHCPPSVIASERQRHSKKPDEVYDLIEGYSHGPYLELFARERREGWDAWGNEVGVDL